MSNLSVQTFVGNSTFGTATTELHTVSHIKLTYPCSLVFAQQIRHSNAGTTLLPKF